MCCTTENTGCVRVARSLACLAPVEGVRRAGEVEKPQRALCAFTRWGKPGRGLGRSTGADRQKGRGLSARLKESPRPVVMVAKQRAARREEKAALLREGVRQRPGGRRMGVPPHKCPTAGPKLHPRGRGRGRASSKRPKKVRLRLGLERMIERERSAVSRAPEREAALWAKRLEQLERKRSSFQDMAAEGLITFDELPTKLEILQKDHAQVKA